MQAKARPTHIGGEDAHVIRRDRAVQRPEVEEQHRNSEADGDDIDREAPFAERPAARGERWTRDAAVDDAADGDGVREEDGDDAEGVECVEGGVGACTVS